MKPSKRETLSALAGVFDPLGLISPLQVGVKVLFQQLCKEKVGWDDEIETIFKVRWHNWIEGMKKVRSISVDRFVLRKVKQGEKTIGALFMDFVTLVRMHIVQQFMWCLRMGWISRCLYSRVKFGCHPSRL